MGFGEVVAEGDRPSILLALRDLLGSKLEGAEPRESAALAKQLVEVLREIDGLPAAEGSQVDDLASRRKSRKAAPPKRAASNNKRG